jgi:hypothetical protein
MASLLSVTFEPVMLEHVRDHAFGKRMSSGCAICKRAKTHPAHHGSPPSMNVLGSGNQFLYQAIKKWWQPLFTEMFEQADLPRPLAGVLVEGEITFPDRGRRDQGNWRGPLEKIVGDALKEGGWLADDRWFPVCMYEFGNLAAVYEKGVSRLRLTVFPTG